MVIEIGCTKVIQTPLGEVALSASDDALVELTFLTGNAKRLDFSNSERAAKQVESAANWLHGR